VADDKNSKETEKKMEYLDSIPEIVSVDKMVEYFNAPNWQMLKTIVYKTDSGKFFSIIIRGDLDVNEIKVRKFVQKKYGE
jgi:prolyl-tRNA editing enzyme YbaK/EbsC (Cys-tRNA(Pro) deacylase)